MTTLLVVVGPIAAGKSTISAAIAEAFAGTVAVTDLDDVVFAQGYSTDAEAWGRGRRVHAELVGAWLRSGVDLVIAHGPIGTPAETEVLLAHVPAGTTVRRLLLLVDVEVALERVTADETRVFSRNEAFLRGTHQRFADLRPELPPCDWTFDTGSMSAVDIAREVSDTIGI